MSKQYIYKYTTFALYTSPLDITKDIEEKGLDGFKLINFIKDYVYFLNAGTSGDAKFKAECHLAIYQREIELDF